MSVEISELKLKLGDIIKIESTKPIYNSKHFFIEYIDDEVIKIINIEDGNKDSLKIDADGCLIDTTIEKIFLLSRSEEEGYARQNKLVPETYIKLVFEDDIEMTGKILNLEEDMIEIEIVGDENSHIFIDFEYKGIPQAIPLQQIVIVEQPTVQESEEKKRESEEKKREIKSKSESESESKASIDFLPDGQIAINIPENAPIDSVSSTDGFKSGEIYEFVEVSEQRYGIDVQVTSLLDELLSTIPDRERTSSVMERIFRIIRRFKELREKFSIFDQNGNITNFKNFNASYKPLVDHMNSLDTKLQWIIPVVKQKVKIFSEFVISDDFVVESDLKTDLDEYKNNLEVYKQNNNYSSFYNGINNVFTPFEKYENTTGILKTDAVKTDLEAIVDNLENYYTYVYNKGDTIEKKRFLVQRYNLAMTKISSKQLRSGKSVYIRENIDNNDPISIKSVIMLPKPVLEFSRINLPGTNILTRSSLSQNWLYHFKLLTEKTNFSKINVDTVDSEHVYEKDSDEENSFFLNKSLSFNISNSINPDYNTILKTIIPRSAEIICLLKSQYTGYNFYDMVSFFEPFLIYADNITWSGGKDWKGCMDDKGEYNKGGPYQQFRKHILTNMEKYNNRRFDQKKKYESLKKIKSAEQKKNAIFEHFNLELQNEIITKYGIKNNNKPSSEVLNHLIELDFGKFYMSLCSFVMSTLYTPDLAKLLDDTSENDTFSNSKSCFSHIIAKKYTSLSSLQKDNGKEDVFFDKEYDTTPYHILKKYKESQKREDFLDYFTLALEKEHGIQPAEKIAKTIIAGKKPIEEDNYAVLIIYPSLKSAFNESSLTQEEKESVDIEADVKKRVSYFKRKGDNWVRDTEMTDAELTNEFFCNSDKNCFYDKNNEICDMAENAAARMKKFAKKNLYEKTVELTMEEFKKEIEKMYEVKEQQIQKIHSIKEMKVKEFSLRAYALGNKALLTDIVVSPYAELRDQILMHVDFAQKQEYIMSFKEKYCRYSLENESIYWLYCKETNTKLLPLFLYSLAQSFFNRLYQDVMDIIIANQGTLSDDGDAIVDKHSGYIICYRDLVAQDEFDDQGFVLKTHDVIKKDETELVEDLINAEIEKNQDNLIKPDKPKKRQFENQTNQYIYNVSNAILKRLKIDIEMDDEILSLAMQIIKNSLIENKKQEKNVYETYKNRHIFYTTAAITFIFIQTRIPSFHLKTTFPGCVYSLSGYPLDNSFDDDSGLKYLCCILEKMKNNEDEPWKSVSKFKSENHLKYIKNNIKEHVLIDPVIKKKLDLKRMYLVLHPEKEIIPNDYNVEKKWLQFQPPLKNTAIEKTVSGVSKIVDEEIKESLRTGHHSQHQHIGTVYKKIIEHTYSTVDDINKIILDEGKALLKAGNIVFLENSCCEELTVEKPIVYFAEKNENIKKSIQFVRKYGEIYDDIKSLSIPAFASSKLKKNEYVSADSDKFSSENIYSAYIHYCKLKTDLPIPDDLLDICQEKIIGLEKMNMEESIKTLNDSGRIQTENTLIKLMGKISRRNQVQISFLDEDVVSFNDFQIQDNIHKHIKSAMETKNHDALNAFLFKLNKRMQEDVFEYLINYGVIQDKDKLIKKNKKEYTGSIADFVKNMSNWTDLTKNSRFIKNTINTCTNVIPSMLENGGMKNTDMSKTKKYWDFAPEHYEKLTRFIDDYFNEIKSYDKDEKVCALFKDISMDIELKDISLLVSELVAVAPEFSEKTMCNIYKYCYLSVFFKIICESDEPKYANYEYTSTKRNDWSERICEDEVNITHNKHQFFRQVSRLLFILLNTDINNKKMTNFSYSDLSDKFHKDSLSEKKRITDKLKAMSKNDRAVENTLKKYKLGDWFVDESVYKYDKNKYAADVGNEGVNEGLNEGLNEDVNEGFVLEEGDEDRHDNEDN